MGTAVLSGQPSVFRNVLNLPAYQQWRHVALEYGFQSLLGLPLVVNDEIIGAVRFYSADKDAFDEDEVRLLAEVTSDLGYGIGVLRLRL